MKLTSPSRIPIPFRERWRDVRTKLVPILIYAGAIAVLAVLWRERSACPAAMGQVEGVNAEVSARQPGVLSGPAAARFDKVAAGQIVGQVITTDPDVLASSLAVVQAEINLLRAERRSDTRGQRLVADYTQLRLDWMNRRTQLAVTRVDLGLAETEFHRQSELYERGIAAQGAYEEAKAKRDALQAKVAELDKLVAEVGDSLDSMAPLATLESDNTTGGADAVTAAVAVQEAKLRLLEKQLRPVTLRAPIGGVVTAVFRRPGEAVTAGEPVLAIAASEPVGIVGYIRQPLPAGLQLGADVRVRTRGLHRQARMARIVDVGVQFEVIPAALLGFRRAVGIDLGIPIRVSVPRDLNLRPGEVVELAFLDSPGDTGRRPRWLP